MHSKDVILGGYSEGNIKMKMRKGEGEREKEREIEIKRERESLRDSDEGGSDKKKR